MNKVVFIDCDQMHVDSIVIIQVARGIPLAIGKIILWTGSFGDILWRRHVGFFPYSLNIV
jgi:hypothetical protein